MKLTEYQNIIWDWNGTLLNDVQLCADIMNNLLRNRSLPALTLDRYREIFTFPVKDYYIKAGHKFKEESFEKIGKDFMDEYEKRKTGCNLFPYAVNVLEKIHMLNINQHLLSAYKQDSLKEIVSYYNITGYFTSIRGLDHIYADGKLELGKQLMSDISKNGMSGKTILMGDTIHDFEVAEEIGADCLLISSGHQNEEILNQLNITVIEDLHELDRLIEEERT